MRVCREDKVSCKIQPAYGALQVCCTSAVPCDCVREHRTTFRANRTSPACDSVGRIRFSIIRKIVCFGLTVTVEFEETLRVRAPQPLQGKGCSSEGRASLCSVSCTGSQQQVRSTDNPWVVGSSPTILSKKITLRVGVVVAQLKSARFPIGNHTATQSATIHHKVLTEVRFLYPQQQLRNSVA